MVESTFATRFPLPTYDGRATSPTRSPTRHNRHQSQDEQVIRELSPTAALRAFTDGIIPSSNGGKLTELDQSIKDASAAEKALGERVARAAQKLRAWRQEIEEWGWSGNFEPAKEDTEGSIFDITRDRFDSNGSIISSRIIQYEQRIQYISSSLEELNLEELKEHIRSLHGPNRSRPPSSSGMKPTNLNLLDDYSFLITRTLLQALPNLSQLQQNLETWTVRIEIIYQAPEYLQRLKEGQTATELAWDVLKEPSDLDVEPDVVLFKWKEATNTVKLLLQTRISALGQQLDQMLDALEGRDDTLPDRWIDEFEALESEYSRWTVEAHRRLLEAEMRVKRLSNQPKDDPAVNLKPLEPDAVSEVYGQESEQGTIIKKVSPRQPAPLNVSEDLPDASFFTGPIIKDDSSVTSWDSADKGSDVMEGERAEMLMVNSDRRDQYVDNTTRNVPLTYPVDGVETSSSPKIITVEEEPELSDEGEKQPKSPLHTPPIPESFDTSPSPPDMSEPASPDDIPESPSLRESTNHRFARAPKPPLNSAMPKRRGRDFKQTLSPRHFSESTVNDHPNVPNFLHPPSPGKNQNDVHTGKDLERQISDILTSIPAPIHLTSEPRAETPGPKGQKYPILGKTPYLRTPRPAHNAITLSPAKSETSSARRTRGGDSDIKLYHLTQPGKDKPIKLFIRRVGENGERVMVRVGGGWADLAEYLRQYAEHHGRRTVSEGRFEVLGLQDAITPKTAGPVSRPGSALSTRPDSALGARPGTSHGAGTGKAGSQGAIGTPTSTVAPGRQRAGSLTNVYNTPSGTSELPHSAASHHSWKGDEVGLAGPTVKKIDLSKEKVDWIESMLDQAKKVDISTNGAAKSGGFGDLGKVGGTKRVFMKGMGDKE
ncbi:hypothetical protein M501DRAFT_933293 [Patellaria atrata CBS 101060]|uniref:GAR domain-containing protein n=1 Tax=Patellaria atrata CBS 101060 TaxID=1346257 RepID=A0A9P4SBK0_9PEZI|nr:hypothetical protein M501DRAFT_933293 [Patellaria atrata CBS 101060]